MVAKIYEKNFQTLAEVIRLVEQLNTEHQLTAPLTPSTVSLAMIGVMFVDKHVILVTTALMPSVMAVINLATLHSTALTRFLHQGHHPTKTDLIQGIDTPTPKGTDCTPPIIV